MRPSDVASSTACARAGVAAANMAIVASTCRRVGFNSIMPPYCLGCRSIAIGNGKQSYELPRHGAGSYKNATSRMAPPMLADDKIFLGTSTHPEYLSLKYGN